jgi:putative radical SAM enzyme (TIGR03279 family)
VNLNKHIITSIERGSISEELDIRIGDELVSINGQNVKDVLDYKYLEKDEEIELVIHRPSSNEEWEYYVEKEVYETLGLDFESGLMDAYKSCHNKCVFCFIDQLPKGMRETMYFKDDDARLSFLQGNYITLTNMRDDDFDRIIEYRLQPINLSIHSMNMTLRKEMLHNRFAGNLIEYMDRLKEAELIMHGQIVLCKGINDGDELEYSIKAMMEYLPYLQSVSVVPVGLTKHRAHLQKLDPFTKDDASKIINLVKQYQELAIDQHDLHYIHAADEFYFLAGEEMPLAETYDGYLQYENGVGMTRLLIDEFIECYNNFDFQNNTTLINHKLTFVTGKLIEKTLIGFAKLMQEKIDYEIEIIGIENDFFGPLITVSGLVTGQDIYKQLKDRSYDRIYIPDNMLKADEEIFLDDITIVELEKKLNTDIVPLDLKGSSLFNAMLGKEIEHE